MIRAYIRENLPGMYLEVALVQVVDDMPTRILRPVDGSGGVHRWEAIPENSTSDLAPTFQIGDSEARALLEALARHYGGAEDVRALRRDYDAERERVDQLTTSLIGVTHALANKSTPEPVVTGDQWRKLAEDR